MAQYKAGSLVFASAVCLFSGNVDPSASIRISCYNYAAVAPAALARAQATAGQRFREAGILVRRKTCPVAAGRPVCPGKSGDGPSLVVGLMPEEMVRRLRTTPWQFGLAATTEGEGFPDYAQVFVGRARDFAADASLSMDVVLGSMIAHEAGHLLLGGNSHSRSGIMRGKWGRSDIRNALMGRLTFTREQALRMQADIHRRNTGDVPR
jgi:hypothetical protein